MMKVLCMMVRVRGSTVMKLVMMVGVKMIVNIIMYHKSSMYVIT